MLGHEVGRSARTRRLRLRLPAVGARSRSHGGPVAALPCGAARPVAQSTPASGSSRSWNASASSRACTIFVRTLSGGQRRRVEIARALLAPAAPVAARRGDGRPRRAEPPRHPAARARAVCRGGGDGAAGDAPAGRGRARRPHDRAARRPGSRRSPRHRGRVAARLFRPPAPRRRWRHDGQGPALLHRASSSANSCASCASAAASSPPWCVRWSGW